MSMPFHTTPEKRASYLAFLKRQLFGKPPILTQRDVNLTGKTIIVTGSNTGLGLETSRQFLDLGLTKLILAVRNPSRGEAARDDLLSGRAAGKHTVEIWRLDLNTYDSITAFVEKTKSLEHLDVVVHNAGLSKRTFERNEETGHEQTIQVNYLALVLLTILILPILREKNTAQQPGRLVLLSSDTAAWVSFKEKDSRPLMAGFDDPKFFNTYARYPTSKLLGQLFLTELARRVPPSVAIVNAANPGFCPASGLLREAEGVIMRIFFTISAHLAGRPVVAGARAVVDAAVQHGKESHGCFIEDGKLSPMAPLVYKPEGEQLISVLWEETMDELAFANAREIVQQLGN